MYKKLLSIILCIALCFSVFNFIGCEQKQSFTVTFSGGSLDAECVDGDEIQVVKNSSQIVEPVYVRDGYNFVGWNISISRIKSSTTVVAQWKKYDMHVVFYSNGGKDDEGKTVVNFTADSAKELIDSAPEFKKKGYALSWEPKLETIRNSCEINAVWTIRDYNLKFKDENGQDFSGNSLSVTYNKQVNLDLVSAPEVDGKKFLYWQDSQGMPIDKGIVWDIDEEAVFTAVYAPQSDYVITYDLNGGDKLYSQVQRSFNETTPLNLKNPTRKGYSFDGWQINGGSEKFLTHEIGLEQFKVDGKLADVTLKALWNNVPYVATLDVAGGDFTGQEQIEFFYGGTIEELPAPQKQNYVFAGWYCDDEQVKAGDVWEYAEDITITAKYRAKYTIKFSLTGEVGIDNQQILCKLTKWGDVPPSSSLEDVELEIIEGQSLLSLGIAIMPVVDPIEEYMVNEYVFGDYWKYIDGENISHKILVNTIFDDKNLPNISAGGTIVLVPHLKIAWSPNY